MQNEIFIKSPTKVYINLGMLLTTLLLSDIKKALDGTHNESMMYHFEDSFMLKYRICKYRNKNMY